MPRAGTPSSSSQNAWSQWRWLLSILLWSAVIISTVALYIDGVPIIAMTFFLLYAGMITLILLIVLVERVVTRVRRRRAMTVLPYIEQAVRLNLPLAEMLQAAERNETHSAAKAIRALREQLSQGKPLTEALEQAFPYLPRRTLGLIAVGEQSGRLGPVLHRLTAGSRRRRRMQDAYAATWYRIYPFVVMLVGALVISIIVIFVFPKFVHIFQDFGIEFPRVAAVVMNIAKLLALPAAAVLHLLLLFMLARSLVKLIVRPRNRGSFATDMLDRALWYLPVARAIVRDRGLADVCRALAETAEAGMPFDLSLAHASQLHINTVLREKLNRWNSAVQRGQPLPDAARDARMPAMIVGMLSTGNAAIADVFDFLARYYETRFSRVRIVLEAAFVPTVAIVMAVLVAGVAVAVVLPLARLADEIQLSTGFW